MIIGMTDVEAAVYDSMTAAGVDTDIVVLYLLRNTNVELQNIVEDEEPEEPEEQPQDIVEQPEQAPVENKVGNTSQN